MLLLYDHSDLESNELENNIREINETNERFSTIMDTFTPPARAKDATLHIVFMCVLNRVFL